MEHRSARAVRESLRKLVSDHGWKRAFRIWAAVYAHDADAVVDRLLQNAETKERCREVIGTTVAAAAIRVVLAGLGSAALT